jgi:hypothetical protein
MARLSPQLIAYESVKKTFMLKTKTDKLRALDFTDKFNMCAYINSTKRDIDIINITHADGLYTIFYLEKTQ